MGPKPAAGLAVVDRAAFEAWLDSVEHDDQCSAHFEGQWCCLDAFDERPETDPPRRMFEGPRS